MTLTERKAVEAYLAHPRVQDHLAVMLSQMPAPIDPVAWAETIRTQLAAGLDTLDGMDDCDTPMVETSLELLDAGEFGDLDVWMSHALGHT